MSSDLDELRVIQQWTSAFSAPAYMRRAKAVEAAWEQLLAKCQKQRDEWLAIPKVRLGLLMALAGNVDAIRPFLTDPQQAEVLRALHDEWRPPLRIPVNPATSPRLIRRPLQHLVTSFARFNGRW